MEQMQFIGKSVEKMLKISTCEICQIHGQSMSFGAKVDVRYY